VSKAVIFDMDGILIDSEPVWNEARVRMATRLGKTWTHQDHEAVMGVSTKEWVAYMLARLEPPLSAAEVEEEIGQTMTELYHEAIPFMPYAVDAVKRVKSHYRLGLASGSIRKLIDIVTTAPELKDKFEVILSADQVERGKPSPDVYLKTAELMGVKPENCICIEDSGNGVLAGKAAGMKVIAVPDHRFPAKPEKLAAADVILDSLAQVDRVLLESLFR
jgi:HAD superfamily hydrolase (TIGR01509 family)